MNESLVGKNVYWYEGSKKSLGSVIIQDNYIILTAQDKNRQLNITTTNSLYDFGISPYNFFKIIPDDVTDFNILNSLKIITNIALSGFLINHTETSNMPLYYKIIEESLNELDNQRINTAQIRIIYTYLKNINNLKINFEDKEVYRFFLWELYNDLLNFSLNINDYAVMDSSLIKCCLSCYLKEGCEFLDTKIKNQLALCLDIIDGLLFSENYKKYYSEVQRLHTNLTNLKKLNDVFFIKNLSLKNPDRNLKKLILNNPLSLKERKEDCLLLTTDMNEKS